MEKSRELFARAFLEAERLDNLNLKSESEIEWDFSEKFEKSMDKLIRKNNRILFSTRKTVAKGLIAAIISITILFTGLMSVTATRETIIKFVKKVFSQYNEIALNKSYTPPADKIENEYTLSKLPDGYELKEYQKENYTVFSLWVNESGEEISLSQMLLDTNITIDNEDYYSEVEINGFEAYMITRDGYGSVLVWNNGYYWFSLSVPSELSGEITAMAGAVCEKNS